MIVSELIEVELLDDAPWAFSVELPARRPRKPRSVRSPNRLRWLRQETPRQVFPPSSCTPPAPACFPVPATLSSAPSAAPGSLPAARPTASLTSPLARPAPSSSVALIAHPYRRSASLHRSVYASPAVRSDWPRSTVAVYASRRKCSIRNRPNAATRGSAGSAPTPRHCALLEPWSLSTLQLHRRSFLGACSKRHRSHPRSSKRTVTGEIRCRPRS